MERFKKYDTNHVTYRFPIITIIVLLLLSLIFQTPNDILKGYIKIIESPSTLLTDYFAVGGIGASLFNAVINLSLTTIVLYKSDVRRITGPFLAAILTVLGFSLFGNTVFNGISFYLGAYFYSKYSCTRFKDILTIAIFSTCLSPVVSEISFGIGRPSILNIILAQAVGVLIGFIIGPLTKEYFNFHKGFNIYGTGFTAGIIGMVIAGVFRLFNQPLTRPSILYLGDTVPIKIIFLLFLLLLLITGLLIENFNLKDFFSILGESGKLNKDIMQTNGVGATFINMALVGLIMFTFIVFSGVKLNGPLMGSLFTLVGNAAFSKHVRNVFPVMLGAFFILYITPANMLTSGSIITIIFSSTLAPIAGYYGFTMGFSAGMMHAFLTSNIGTVHGGLVLYNNGFAGGFVAAIFIPLIDALKAAKKCSDID